MVDNSNENELEFGLYQEFSNLFSVDDLISELNPISVTKHSKHVNGQKRNERISEHKRSKRKAEHYRRRQRLKNVGETLTPKVLPFTVNFCIDFSMASVMSMKEVSRLIRQLGRIRGLQKRYLGLSIALHSFSVELATEARQMLSGFDKYGWNLMSHDEFLFTMYILKRCVAKKAVYLSPDSSLPPLLDLSRDNVYIIGGLVDETGVGSLTRDTAEMYGAAVYRLPIKEFMRKKSKGTYNVTLPINLVVEILIEFIFTKQWGKTLTKLLPARIGYESL
uniref:SAM-dependent MTase TRM10-type domain-containing protein n=1 Tax=Syphacia muris TaxID=451379 RepID=A0A0N5AH62_9BILA